MTEYRGAEISAQHTEWFIGWIEMVYKDAMLHGYRHGWEDAKNENTKQ